MQASIFNGFLAQLKICPPASNICGYNNIAGAYVFHTDLLVGAIIFSVGVLLTVKEAGDYVRVS